jgi:glycosyltransferase involved in cell wall biosynthesis
MRAAINALAPSDSESQMAEHSARKVTIVGLNYAPEPTGIAPYTTGLGEGLAESGVSVHAVTGYPHYPQWKIYEGYTRNLPVERHNGVVITRVRHFVPASPRLANRFIMELTFGIAASLSSWNRPDVAILVSPALFSTAIAALRARLFHIPTCIWVQDIYCLGVPQTGMGGGKVARLLSRIERSSLRSASTIVVIHERFKRYLVAELGLPAERIEVVRNWTHVHLPTGGGTREEIRASLGWKPDDIVVLHAGNIGAKQGLESVVEASARAVARGSHVRFVLLGDGNQRAILQSMGGNSRLDYLDPLPEGAFMSTLGAADFLLVNERPGVTEMSVPSKLTSYFSTGLPVIAATDESSVTAEEIALSGGGIRIDAANPDALVDAAEALAGAPGRSAALGESGRQFAARLLSPQPAMEAFSSIIDRIIGRPTRRELHAVTMDRNSTGGPSA